MTNAKFGGGVSVRPRPEEVVDVQLWLFSKWLHLTSLVGAADDACADLLGLLPVRRTPSLA